MLADLVAKVDRLGAHQAAVDADLLPVLQRGLFTVLDKEGLPMFCGFFVSESGVALTVHHQSDRWLNEGGIVHAVMLKQFEAAGMTDNCSSSAEARTSVALTNLSDVAASCSSNATTSSDAALHCSNTVVAATQLADVSAVAAAPHEVALTFRVHSFSQELDYSCMVLISRVPYGMFKPLAIPVSTLPFASLIGARATLLQGSIALNRHFSLEPSASLVACSIFTAHPQRVLYTAAAVGGDCGGALVLSGKVLVAMHVEGVNDVPEDVELEMDPCIGKRRAHKRIKLSSASPTNTAVALRLDLPEIRAAVYAAQAVASQAASVV
jgi:hypothetical protein